MSEPPPRYASPTLLTETHDCADFNSGEAVLDEWLRQRAWNNQQSAASRTYVVCPVGTQQVVGYFSLSMGQIIARDVTGAMRRNMPTHIPAVTLGRLAIDSGHQGKGLGVAMLQNVVERALRASQEVSARLIIVHAISPAAEAFYMHHGFMRLPVETPTFALDMVKLSRVADTS